MPSPAPGRNLISAAANGWKSGTHSIRFQDRERTLVLDVPSRLQPRAALVMVFHGYTGSAAAMRESSGFSPLVERHGFVAVYPQGTRDGRGHAFHHVGYAFHADSDIDDVGFARELAIRLVRDLDLDPSSVFATGMSNGGDMSYLLAAQREPFVRAIAPVAGTMMTTWGQHFTPPARISLLAVHGTHDEITRWQGDPRNRDGWGAYMSVPDVLDRWTNGLALESLHLTRTVDTPPQVARSLLARWTTHADATEVRFHRLEGGGHEWPPHLGSPHRSTAAEIWDFFDAHRRNP